MPKEWHDRHAANKIDDEQTRLFYRSIVADKKPYFMRYIYQPLMKQYNTYIKNTNSNSMIEFGMTVDELKSLKYSELTERQKEFLVYYDRKMPVGVGDCIMNKICRMFENEFDGYINKHSTMTNFDYSIMKSDEKYNASTYYSIEKLYKDYIARSKDYSVFANYEDIDKSEKKSNILLLKEEFIQECSKRCPNSRTLCNIIIDICYKKSSTKSFAWVTCGNDIIANLLEKNGNIISFPTLSEDGDIEYGGLRFKIEQKKVEEV